MTIPLFISSPLPISSHTRSNVCQMCAVAPATKQTSVAVGTRVRVSEQVIMYHYPGKKGTEVNVQGFEGVVKKDISVQDGIQMSATAPFLVDFSETHPKFKAHFAEHELEIIE